MRVTLCMHICMRDVDNPYICPEKLEEAPGDPQVPLYHGGSGPSVDLTGVGFSMVPLHLLVAQAGLWAWAAESTTPGGHLSLFPQSAYSTLATTLSSLLWLKI